MKRINNAIWVTCVSVGLALLAGSTAKAQVASETTNYFGTLGQGLATTTNTNAAFMAPYTGDSVAIAPNACVPTSTINGLTYLENYDNVVNDTDPFSVSPNSQAQLNALATNMNTFNTTRGGVNGWTNVGGTPTATMYNGLQTYLNANAPSVKVSGEISPSTPASYFATSLSNANPLAINPAVSISNVTPTAQFLANALTANDGVQICIEWGSYNGNVWTSQGAHFLTLQSINMAGGTGTMSFYDPWGDTSNGPLTHNDLVLNATVTTQNGFLYVTYPTDLVGAPGETDYGNPFASSGPTEMTGWNGQAGRIDYDMVEAVPEPGSIGLLFLAVAGLGLRRVRRAA